MFYGFEKTNFLIIQAFVFKDNQCGTNHKITSLIPGNGRKTDVDACIRVIDSIDCNTWKAKDPIPIQCTNLEYKTK
ncbi:MAG: hypothetical protein K8R21_04395 [Leptospira sp.]|nr:hypothetical protein [Leptospira sp.]